MMDPEVKCSTPRFVSFPSPQIHTPDSSRYWIADTYSERHSKGMEPENIDKEFLRLWFRSVCDPYKDKASGWTVCLLSSVLRGWDFSVIGM